MATPRLRPDEDRVLGAQTIVRALAVLGVLRRAPGDVGVTDIARELSFNTSTAHRILKALVLEGYVAQNPDTDRYRLGREAFLLGLSAGRDLGLTAITPILERLQETTGESVNLVVRDGSQGLVVLRVDSEQPLRFSQPVGARIPLYCTSSGKVLLAFAADHPDELETIDDLPRMTPLTITSRRALLVELRNVRHDGYSVNRGERIAGVSGVAAPIRGSGTHVVTAAVAVQGPAVRMPEERLPGLGRLLIEAAAEIAALLPDGYRI